MSSAVRLSLEPYVTDREADEKSLGRLLGLVRSGYPPGGRRYPRERVSAFKQLRSPKEKNPWARFCREMRPLHCVHDSFMRVCVFGRFVWLLVFASNVGRRR